MIINLVLPAATSGVLLATMILSNAARKETTHNLFFFFFFFFFFSRDVKIIIERWIRWAGAVRSND
jgi:hypothetical protein